MSDEKEEIQREPKQVVPIWEVTEPLLLTGVCGYLFRLSWVLLQS